METLPEIYEQGIGDILVLMDELSDASIHAALANAATAIACNRQEESAQAIVRCMRAHVQTQREGKQKAAPDRKVVLLKATYNLLKKCNESEVYVLNVLEEKTHYDGADCDGNCLMEDIGFELDIEEEE